MRGAHLDVSWPAASRTRTCASRKSVFSPEFYRHTFLGIPDDFEEMLRYAWVGGSIRGAQFGGFASVVVGLVVLRANWRGRRWAARINEPGP